MPSMTERLLYLPLSDGAALADRVVLDEATVRRAAGLKGHRQVSYLAGRALLALALRHFYGIPQLPELVLEVHGRPRFADPALPDFSLSHSGEALVLLLGDGPLGVDIELHKPRRNLPKLMAAVLGEAERGWLAELDEASQLANFYRLWTLREAIVKASGRGIAGFSRIAIEPQTRTVRTDEVAGGSLLCAELGSYSLALCLPGADACWPEGFCCDEQGQLAPLPLLPHPGYRLLPPGA